MADTTTSNYSWVKPEISASNNTWGAKLNANFDAIDAKVKSLDFTATAKTTLVNDDRVAFMDSAASCASKYITFANLKTLFPDVIADIGAAAGSKLFGRYSATAGAGQEIGLGTGLEFSGSNLTPNARLQNLAGLAASNNYFLVGDGTNVVLKTPAASRASLGLGTAALEDTGYFVPSGRSVLAGNGMTGGGSLVTAVTITMGTPGTLSDATGNATTTSSHTHNVDSGGIVSAGMSGKNVAAIGTYVFARRTGNGVINGGDTVAGSTLDYASADGTTQTSSVGGTWRAMGRSGGSGGTNNTTLWMRVT